MATSAKQTPSPMPWKDPVRTEIPELRNCQMAAIYYGQRCSGDFYDCVRVSSNRIVFGLFDIAGKIQQSRPIVLAVQQSLRSWSMELFERDGLNESEAMLDLWLGINRNVITAASGVHACPAFLGCYNEELKTLTYVNAGHTPGLVRDQTSIKPLPATALPIGLFSHSVPDASVIAMQPGDALLMVSKGMIEARHRGEEFGIERVHEYLLSSSDNSAHEICVGILSQVRQFMGTAPTHNDVTALSLVRSQ
jgi:sigma-B regulation protein RsbU (phosphoserine phosphatase)